MPLLYTVKGAEGERGLVGLRVSDIWLPVVACRQEKTFERKRKWFVLPIKHGKESGVILQRNQEVLYELQVTIFRKWWRAFVYKELSVCVEHQKERVRPLYLEQYKAHVHIFWTNSLRFTFNVFISYVFL